MRYLVFNHTTYYPEGGMNDCVLKTDDVDEAVAKAIYEHEENFNYSYIYDTHTGEYVTVPKEE